MKKFAFILLIVSLTFVVSCKKENMQAQDIKPPIADIVPKEMESHGETRTDNYYWMRLSDEQKNAKNPDVHTQKVRDYLNSENDYFAQR